MPLKYPEPNETPEWSFIDLYQTLRYQFQDHAPSDASNWGEIRPKEMLLKADSDDAGLRVFGLTAKFTVLDREIALTRWEFPSGHFSFVSFRELRRNSEDPFVKPFKNIPLHYLTSYLQLTEGSTPELDRVAAAAAADEGLRPFQYLLD